MPLLETEQFAMLDGPLLRCAQLPIENWDSDALGAELDQVQASQGTDFATAWLYHTLTHHPRHRDFIVEFEASSTAKPPDNIPLTVCVVPGAFYQEYPRIDSSGHALREQLRSCGVSTQLIPVRSTGTLQENAQIIRHFLRDHADEPLALISLSKGSADIKVALRQNIKDFQNVRLWYSLSGSLSGVQLVNWVQQRWWARTINAAYFRWQRRDIQFFTDLARACNGPLALPLLSPKEMTIVHVAAFPLQRHTQTRLAQFWYGRFQKLGPTDSMIMLRELLHLPGYVLPVWGVDHYWKSAAAVSHIAKGFVHHAQRIMSSDSSRSDMRKTVGMKHDLPRLPVEQAL